MELDEFKNEMWSAMFTMRRHFARIIEPLLSSEGLNMLQTAILLGLSEVESSTVGGLCRELALNQGNVSTVCKSLEKDGLIKRTRSKDDERIVTLSLTPEGNDVIKRLQSHAHIYDDALGQVSADKLRLIVDGMKEFAELIRQLTP